MPSETGAALIYIYIHTPENENFGRHPEMEVAPQNYLRMERIHPTTVGAVCVLRWFAEGPYAHLKTSRVSRELSFHTPFEIGESVMRGLAGLCSLFRHRFASIRIVRTPRRIFGAREICSIRIVLPSFPIRGRRRPKIKGDVPLLCFHVGRSRLSSKSLRLWSGLTSAPTTTRTASFAFATP